MSRIALLFSTPIFMLGIASASAQLAPSLTSSTMGGASFFSDQLEGLNKQIKIYQDIVSHGGWPHLQKGAKIEPGMHSDRVATIREILSITGDYRSTAQDARLYDEPLVDAIRQFQMRHGLKDDGIIGKSTQDALAVPAEERLAQLQINADRLRNFAMSDTNPTSIVVNIPAYELYAIENKKLADDMRVIVGATKNKTPLMDNEITYLQFNPNWYVPSRIAANEMLPKIKNDPGYLSRSGFTLSQNGERVNPHNVDWENYGRGNFPFSIVQKSGDGNALGKVKFHIPDSGSIYLHDTSNPKLFAKEDRALSHGCVRLEDPLALAQFVLRNGSGMAPEEAKEIYDKSKSERVALETPLPVHIVYWTAWTKPDSNQPYFYRDVYDKDGQLLAEKKREQTSTKLASR